MIPKDKKLLVLDLSIPKNVDERIANLPHASLVHMDYLSQLTDETLERRKSFVPKAEAIIEEVEEEFNQWLKSRKFAPTIKALKRRLSMIKEAEIDFQRKKIEDFNELQAEIISDRIIHKITTQLANHLKDDRTTEDSIDMLQRIFQLDELY